jgi:hypothetical protein
VLTDTDVGFDIEAGCGSFGKDRVGITVVGFGLRSYMLKIDSGKVLRAEMQQMWIGELLLNSWRFGLVSSL